MSKREERIEGLRRRGEFERETLAREVAEMTEEAERRKSRWKTVSLLAGGAAAAGTVAYKLFGRSSLSAWLGRATTLMSFMFSVGRAVGRSRKFW
jgi:formate/nitrite transporter FocA (FNT family)